MNGKKVSVDIHGLLRKLGDRKIGVLGVILASILDIASLLRIYSAKITNLGVLKIVPEA